MSKYFPIQTATACRLKWAWSTLYLTEGVTGSCHRASHADLTKDNFNQFHNLTPKLRDRAIMLEGQWPGAGCEYCRDIELAGGHSDRQFQLQVPDVYPPELDLDPQSTVVDPVILEVFFDKTCNLGCLYCTERLSSTIARENQKFGHIAILGDRGIHKQSHYDELSPLFWDWLEENSSTLMRLHVLGGEPLIQPDFLKITDFFERRPNPRLELNFVTNLMVKPTHLNHCVDRLQTLLSKGSIGRVEILASVDSWGPAQEYVRWGFERDTFESNLQKLIQQETIRLGLLSTVNALSIHELPDLAYKWREWNTTRELFWYLHLVLPIDQHVLSPGMFDYATWQPYMEHTLGLIDDDTFDRRHTKHLLQGIMAKLKQSQYNAAAKANLVAFLSEMDRRRQLDWQKTFPWLQQAGHVV